MSLCILEYTNKTEARDWVAEIFLDLLEEDGVITVTINSPPKEFRFTSFDYRLFQSNNTLVKHETNKVTLFSICLLSDDVLP